MDIRRASHMEAVNSLTSQAFEILLEVRHDPQPPGLQVYTEFIEADFSIISII